MHVIVSLVCKCKDLKPLLYHLCVIIYLYLGDAQYTSMILCKYLESEEYHVCKWVQRVPDRLLASACNKRISLWIVICIRAWGHRLRWVRHF